MIEKPVVGIPTIAAVILGVVGGVAQIINYNVTASVGLHSAIAVGLVFLVGIGIPPLTGKTFQAVVHLPPQIYYVVSSLVATLTLTLTTIHLSGITHEVVAVIITVLSGLGFSASSEATPPTPVVR